MTSNFKGEEIPSNEIPKHFPCLKQRAGPGRGKIGYKMFIYNEERNRMEPKGYDPNHVPEPKPYQRGSIHSDFEFDGDDDDDYKDKNDCMDKDYNGVSGDGIGKPKLRRRRRRTVVTNKPDGNIAGAGLDLSYEDGKVFPGFGNLLYLFLIFLISLIL